MAVAGLTPEQATQMGMDDAGALGSQVSPFELRQDRNPDGGQGRDQPQATPSGDVSMGQASPYYADATVTAHDLALLHGHMQSTPQINIPTAPRTPQVHRMDVDSVMDA